MAYSASAGKVRFGLIGCGEIGMQSADAIRQSPELCSIAAVQDVAEDLAQDEGQRYSAPHYTDAGLLLQREDVDAVLISTPHFLHGPLTVQAARAGKHVACEKPIACTRAQADEMIAACHEAGVFLSICYILRYQAAITKARELLQQEVIGRLIRYRCQITADKPASYWTGGYSQRVKTNWRMSKEKAGGGVLFMNGSHNLDRMHWITGLKPQRVFAEMDTFDTPVEVEDSISLVLRYANGAIGSLDAMSCARGGEGSCDRLYGTHGQMDVGQTLRVYTSRADVPGVKPRQWTDLNVPEENPYVASRVRFFAEFAHAVRNGATQGPIPGEEARDTLDVCLAAYESARTHLPVNL